MIQLVLIDKLNPSAYNPRKSDPRRLDLIELSLRKLGFLLPIYADENGEILSGHQRHFVAKRIGLSHVPVEYVPALDLEKRKAINILFNRATNDFRRDDTSRSVTASLEKTDIHKLSELIEDSEIIYTCMNQTKVSYDSLLSANRGKWNRYSRNLAMSLYRYGLMMPVVIAPDLTVINGIGRLELLLEKKSALINTVIVPKERVEFARAMLNLLSMDFDLHTKYEDLLRHNSFRRAMTNRAGLGLGFYIAAFGLIRSKEFKFSSQDIVAKWKTFYGTKVLDFGAGHLTDTEILRSIKVDVTPFEPYKILPNTNDIDKEESLSLTREFLHKVKSGYQWDSIFISSVLNSVPFLKDRQQIVRILSACTSQRTKVYAWAMSIKQHQYVDIQAQSLNEKCAKSIQFKLDYEPGIIIGNFSSKPKIQKFHTPLELKELFSIGFEEVKIEIWYDNILAICSKPVIDFVKLREAILFEFELPYPDGSRMGLSELALDAFSTRLGVDLCE